MVGLALLLVAALDTLLALPLFGSRALDISPLEPFQGWSGAHPLGTDELGRDELARLLVGIHSSVLFAGMVLVLAVVLGSVALAAVRLVGRTRDTEWSRWAEIVLLPVVSVLLLGIASLVTSRQMPAFFPSLISSVGQYIWYTLRYPLSIGAAIGAVLVYLLIIGEVARFGFLLIQRLRQAGNSQASAHTAGAVPAWLSIVGPAVVVGLWIAADAWLIEPAFTFYGVGEPVPPIPSLGELTSVGRNYAVSQPQLALMPLIAVLVLYAACNLVGFGMRGVLRSAAKH
jgi:peptide/nickel transport system permease protein